jgi:rhomboid family GlyGly-CTERM serine protease
LIRLPFPASVGPRAWLALCVVFAAGALAAGATAPERWDWQPQLAWQQPWRAWTAAFVHWSALHLGANLLGTLLVAALGVAAACDARCALAWVLAWPATHWALLAQPELAHYGGLSGVLHAGVAVAALRPALDARGRARTIAIALLAGLAGKVLLEAPWGSATRSAAGWDIAIAPLAHASGTVSGCLFAVLLRPRRPA